MIKLRKVVSGGQIGVDRAGLEAARKAGLETGGYVPKGYITKVGPDLTLKHFNVTEMPTEDYKRRTWKNVEESDGTVRLAENFKSRGEVCTMNAILATDKPYFDVDLNVQSVGEILIQANKFIQWLDDGGIAILNVAGNATDEAGQKAYRFLEGALVMMGFVDPARNSSHSVFGQPVLCPMCFCNPCQCKDTHETY